MRSLKVLDFQNNVINRKVSNAGEFLAFLAAEAADISKSIACFIFRYNKEELKSTVIFKFMDQTTQGMLCESMICNLACNLRITEYILRNEIYIPEKEHSTIAGFVLNTCVIPIFQDCNNVIYAVMGKNTLGYNRLSLSDLQIAFTVLWQFYCKMLRVECLRDEIEQLSKNAKQIDEFIRNISFEFRTPLNAITGFSNLILENGNLSQEEKKYLGIIAESSGELVRTITNFEEVVYKRAFQIGQVRKQEINDASSSFSKTRLKIILVAEDDEINFLLIRQYLKDYDFNIVRVINGVEAVNYCKNNKPDLVLMDIKMPQMDGFEAAIQIRKMHPELRIIAQTAYLSEKEKILDCGCIDTITKPFSKLQLISIINSYV